VSNINKCVLVQDKKHTFVLPLPLLYQKIRVRVMMFNTTFNNISVILWSSVLLVEEIGVSGENHNLLQVT